MNFPLETALTPSPSPTRLGEASGVARVRWERVAAGRVRVRFMESFDLRLWT